MDQLKLLDLLDKHLSVAELSHLCRQFSLDYDAFPGASRRDKTRAFLGYMQRKGRMAGLAEALVALRPDLAEPVARLFTANESQLSWIDGVAGGEGAAVESAMTWRWSSGSQRPAAPATPTEEPPTPILAPIEPPAANPYTPGRRVSDEAMFFGREAEQAFVLAQLDAGVHVAIVGARTLGASSLLHHVAHRAGGKGRLVACVDMKDAACQTLPGLLDAVWGQWWAAVKPGSPAPVTTLAEFVTATRKLRLAGFQPLLFLDEFEQMVWRPAAFDDNLFDALAELGGNGEIGFVLTGHATPADLLAQGGYRTRFYELFRQLDVGLLDEAAARALLTVPAQRAGLALPEGAADHLLAQAGPHPFYLHLAGLYLYDGLAKGSYSRAQVGDRFRAAAAPYWQELWDGLSPLAQQHYPTAAVRVGSGMAERQLRILANRGLVVAEAAGYRPFSAGFGDWLRRHRAAAEAAAAVVTPVEEGSRG